MTEQKFKNPAELSWRLWNHYFPLISHEFFAYFDLKLNALSNNYSVKTENVQ